MTEGCSHVCREVRVAASNHQDFVVALYKRQQEWLQLLPLAIPLKGLHR